MYFSTVAGTLSAGHVGQIANWGLSQTGANVGLSMFVTFSDNSNAYYSFNATMCDNLDKIKVLTSILASIKANGGKARYWLTTNGTVEIMEINSIADAN
jgi:hypothetical protein